MSFLTALSGLNAAQKDIAATSNNIANVGTIGFHGSRAEFADIFSNSPYNNPRTQVGDGVETARMARDFSQGSTKATGNVLDLSLRGPGFFQVRTEGEGSELAYTRAGAFQMNNNGYVVNAAGAQLMSFPTAQDGTPISTTRTEPLMIPPTRGEAKASANISLSVALPLGDNNGMGGQSAIPAPDFSLSNTSSYAFSTEVPAFDAEGNSIDTRAYFVMSDAPDADDASVSYDVYFSADGEVSGGPTPDFTTVSFDENGMLVGSSALSFMAGESPVTLNLAGSNVSTDTNFAVKSTTHDGERPLGLSKLEILDDGAVYATYGGEDAIAIGRVAVANFGDVQALTPTGNATYLATTESGAPRLNAPGEAGFGQLRSGVIEQSNVELTEELVHLITAQRNYQASAKALETSSTLAQTIIQMRG